MRVRRVGEAQTRSANSDVAHSNSMQSFTSEVSEREYAVGLVGRFSNRTRTTGATGAIS